MTQQKFAGTLTDWLSEVQELLNQGQFFLAQDYAHAALEQFPDNTTLIKLKARALLEAGAIDEARKTIEPFANTSFLDKELLESTYARAKSFFSAEEKSKKTDKSWFNLKQFAEISLDMSKIADMMRATADVDEEALSLMSRIYKHVWQRHPTETNFKHVYTTTQTSVHQHENAESVYNATLFAFIKGDKAEATKRARAFLEKHSESSDITLNHALLALILGDKIKAEAMFKTAMLRDHSHHTLHVIRRELHLLESHGIKIPNSIKERVKPPVIVAFTGHMIDAASRTSPRFPPQAEPYVKEAIQKALSNMNASIGYASAASGGDLIFLESLLEMGSEINIVLPFAIPDFIDVSVGFSGKSWIQRFHHTMKLAHSLSFATEEAYLRDDILFQFCGLLVFGQSLLRARTLEAEPYLMALWDKTESGLIGGTADVVGRWQNKDTLCIIDMNELRDKAPKKAMLSTPAESVQATPALTSSKARVVKSLLFADVVGFSKLGEHHVPGFIAFMQDVAKNLNTGSDKPIFINTWGDAIFSILDDAMSMAKYALNLKQALLVAGQKDYGLPTQLSLRIGLHVGPVYADNDPITDRLNFYGSHVNRAARIEPVTIPGRVYASEQFVSLLAAEEAALVIQEKKKNKKIEFPWIYEYVGTLALAKKFGAQRIYHLTEKLG